MKHECVVCGKNNLDKDTIGINKKLLGMELVNFYCMDCLADYLEEQAEETGEALFRPPSEQGIPADFWDVPRLADWMHEHFNVEYRSRSSYHRRFHMAEL